MRQEQWRFTNVGADRAHRVRAGERRRARQAVTAAARRAAPLRRAWRTRSSSTAASPGALATSRGCPAGVEIGSLAAALAGGGRALELLGRGARFEDQPFVALNTALFEDGALAARAARRGGREADPAALLRHRRADAAGRGYPRTLAGRRGEQPRDGGRELRRHRRADLLHLPGHRDRGRAGRARRPLQGAAGGARRLPRRPAAVPLRARLDGQLALALLRRPARAHRRARQARRRGGRRQPERSLPHPRAPAGRQPHVRRARRAALLEPRALQGDPRGALAGGLQRSDPRPPGRPEDRRQADQPQPAASRARPWSTPTRSC